MDKSKVNWGIMGTAWIAKEEMLKGMMKANDSSVLYAIAGRDPQKTADFAKEFQIQKEYTNYQALLDDPKVDAVYIALPNNMHKEWVLKAAAKKKHVLCEKPLSGNAKDTQDMIDGCKAEGVYFMEAFAYLHSNATMEVIEAVKNKVIGEPYLIESTFITPGWDKDNIRMKKETFGGSIYDLGCYNISLILSLYDEMPIQVEAAAHFIDSGVDDFASILMEFEGGKKAVSVSGMCTPQRGDRYFIYGTEGTIEATLPFNAEGKLTYKIHKNGKSETKTVEVKSNYCLETEQFARCILNGEEPRVSHVLSQRVAKVIDMALEKIKY